MSTRRLLPPHALSRAAFVASALLAAALAARAPASGQEIGVTAGAAVSHEVYRFTSPEPGLARTASLSSVPFAARLQLPWGGLSVDASGAFARGEVQLEGGSAVSLAGLADTELRISSQLRVRETALSVSAVALLPTGHAEYTLDEALVAGMIASDILPFRVSGWGAGGGQAVELAVLRPLPWGSVGVAASYRLAGEFRPLSAFDVRYQPGNELRIRVAADRALENAGVLSLQLAYSRFGDDRWAGYSLMRSGQRLLAISSYTGPAWSGTASAYAGVLHRSGGALSESVWLSGMLSGVVAPASETLLVLGSSGRIPWRDRLLAPAIDLRVLRHGDASGTEALVSLGGSAELPAGSVRLVPGARLRLGTIQLTDQLRSGVQGLELSVGVKLGGAGQAR